MKKMKHGGKVHKRMQVGGVAAPAASARRPMARPGTMVRPGVPAGMPMPTRRAMRGGGLARKGVGMALAKGGLARRAGGCAKRGVGKGKVI
jgi:hypothetical protein